MINKIATHVVLCAFPILLIGGCNSVPTPRVGLPANNTPASTVTTQGAIAAPAIPAAPVVSNKATIPLTAARVAFAPVVGATPEVVTKLGQKIGASAAQNGLTIVATSDPSRTHLIKGYLSSTDGDSTTSASKKLTYVWDIHTVDGKRLQRVSGSIVEPDADQFSPWVGATDTTLASVGNSSVARIAAWYENRL